MKLRFRPFGGTGLTPSRHPKIPKNGQKVFPPCVLVCEFILK